MTYPIVQPPFELNFRGMPKKELIAYREWFHSAIPKRIDELEKVVMSTPGFEAWRADATPNSLGPLGEWFRREVKTRKQSDAEIDEINARLTFAIDVPDEELTNRTFSLAMDIGMYFGQVVLKNLAGTRWDQSPKNPRFVDYGQPVIMGFGIVSLNPVRIAVTLAYAFAAQERLGERLRELFDVWSEKRA